jgi:hypothetical protein
LFLKCNDSFVVCRVDMSTSKARHSQISSAAKDSLANGNRREHRFESFTFPAPTHFPTNCLSVTKMWAGRQPESLPSLTGSMRYSR